MAGKKPIPAHIKKHIETTTGRPLRFTSETARTGPCKKCGALILTGHDTTQIINLDPYLLTPQQEAAAYLTHRPTHGLHGYPANWQIGRPRTAGPKYFATAISPANPPHTKVLAHHQCGKPPLSRLTFPLRPPPPTLYDGPPPY